MSRASGEQQATPFQSECIASMPIQVTAEETISIGASAVVEGPAPEGRCVAVFEDDGDTGYFYAVDPSAGGNPIQDAVHIYNVANVADRDAPSVVQIGWSADSRKVVLLINGHPHAVFDFESKRGFCRTGFPPPSGEGPWSVGGHRWDDAALQLFV
ncbi:DUF2251 domain-containing protein [Piscinibacter gummiphilus]|nr:DUF2251 domain-containing protein [Piscinibacter gummiphilus]GLS94413.1 hypothetical protein GCM10007918_17050 [Piscinibacter gummiphilus]